MSDINTSAVFSAFIEADKALRELPAVREELDATKSHLNTTNEVLKSTRAKAEMLADTIDHLRAELAQKEAELTSATFRHDELAKVVSAISGLLPVKPVMDSPALVSEARTEHNSVEHNPTEHKDLSVMDPTATKTATSTDSHGMNSTPTVYPSERSEDHSNPNPNPTEVANSAIPALNPTLASAQVTHNSMLTSQPSNEPLPHNPSQSSAPAPAPGNTPAQNSGINSDDDRAPAKPYSGRPYWGKPADITLARFAELGGNVPDWMYTATAASII